MPIPWHPSRDDEPDPAPTGSQRGLGRLRDALDRAAAERGAYVRLSTVPAALAAPEGAIVAAFERADVLELDPMTEIIGTGVDPERALADFAFAAQVVRRAGTTIQLGAGPPVVAPDLDAGVNSDPATRAGRSLALQLLAVALAARFRAGRRVRHHRGAAGLAHRRARGRRPRRRRGGRSPGPVAESPARVRRAARPRCPGALGRDRRRGPARSRRRVRHPAAAAGAAFGTVAAGAHAAAQVARELDGVLGPRALDGVARAHAAGSIDVRGANPRAARPGWLDGAHRGERRSGAAGAGSAVTPSFRRPIDRDPVASRPGLKAGQATRSSMIVDEDVRPRPAGRGVDVEVRDRPDRAGPERHHEDPALARPGDDRRRVRRLRLRGRRRRCWSGRPAGSSRTRGLAASRSAIPRAFSWSSASRATWWSSA